MGKFRYASAAGADWTESVAQCAATLGSAAGNLGFVYVTDLLCDHLQEIVAALKMATGVEHWVGTVGIGICAGDQEYFDAPAMAVMAGDFEPDSFHVFRNVRSAADAKALSLACGDTPAAFAVVHADPYAGDVAELVGELSSRVETGFLVGGLTSSRRRNLQVADGITQGGLSGVAFSDAIPIATRLTQGCVPIGTRHKVTSYQRNVIVTLNGRPAFEVLKEDVGDELAHDLGRLGGQIFAGLPVPDSDTGDYVVRNLVGIDPSSNLVAIGEMLHPESSVMFCRRDRETAREDMARMLSSIKEGLYARPRGAIYYSCLGRGSALFGENSSELKMIREALGDVPLVGFFCNGEISHNRLYGYTGVLTLFV